MERSKQAIRAVLLAAGQGKRMKSSRAKVLHDVLGKPILARVIEAVEALRVEHIHIVVGHAADQVRDFLAKAPPKVPCSIHLQEPQLGTGDALRRVQADLKGFTGTLLVSVADAPLLTGQTLGALVSGHRSSAAVVTVLSTMVDDPKNYGRVLRERNGDVIGIVEDKDATDEQKKVLEINTAIYCFDWPTAEPGLSSLKNDNNQKEYYLTDLVGWAVADKLKVSAVVAPDWREVAGINSRLELAEAIRLLRDITVTNLALEHGVTIVDPNSTWIAPEVTIGNDSVVLPGCYLTGDIKIGSHCSIGPQTVLQGPVSIGANSVVIQSHVTKSAIGSSCRVGPFAHLRDGNELSDHVRIGNFVELKNTSVSDHSNVSHLSYLGDCQMGSRSNIGAGTITANYNHVTKQKQRTIIGDDASTGSNSVLVAPVTVSNDAMVGAGTVVTKDVPAGALSVARADQKVLDGYVYKKRQERTDNQR